MKSLISSIAIALTLALGGCGSDPPPQKVEDHGKLVKVITLTPDDAGFVREYPGRVKASMRVDLAFEVSGRLMELPIKEGDKVKAEQLLARINPHDFQQRVNQEKAKYDYAVVTYQRYKTLLKSDTISRAAYDEKFAQLQVAKANLATATKSLNDTHLKAPFNGYIANRFVENFEYVRAIVCHRLTSRFLSP